MGSCTAEQVAQAVVAAIGRRVEVVGNSWPMRPRVALAEPLTDLGDRPLHAFGAVGLQCRMVGAPPVA